MRLFLQMKWDNKYENHLNRVKQMKKIYELLGIQKITNDVDYVRYVITKNYLISKNDVLIRSLDECYHSHLLKETRLCKISKMVRREEIEISRLLTNKK